MCVAGECVRPVGPGMDGGTTEMDAGRPHTDAGTTTPPVDDRHRVLASGGGGCVCAVPGSEGASGERPFGAVGLIVALAITIARRRRGAR